MRVLEQHTGMTAHQTLLLEMLKDIDIVCKRRRISYQLFAGTALGAVRHHGFIPWDDDVDIIMSRSEYERFFKEAAKDFDETLYFAQQEHSAHWPMPYSKLRRNNTTCIEKYYPKDLKTHQGVYVDIFPCDNLSDCTLMRKIQFCVSKIIIAKSLYARGYETNSVIKKLFIRCLHEKQSSGSLMHQTLMNRRCRAEPTQAGWRRYISFPDGVHHSSIFCGTQCGDSANGKPRRFWSGCRHLPLMSYF